MSTITAFQHFYSRVPREQSPKRQAGFQTLFRTRGLNTEAIRAIESRAQYTTALGEPTKRQFYPLPGEMVAISQSVALPEPDEFGRKGRYLTHTLVLDSENFSKVGASPLDILKQFRFLTTLAQVFDQCNHAADEAPPASFTIESEWEMNAIHATEKWTYEMLIRLGRLVWQTKQLREKHEPVILVGSDTEQFDVLGILFLLAAPSQQRQLSFDTYAAGCNWGREALFWAQGYAELDLSLRTAHVIDAHRQNVITQLVPSDDGLFAKWMVSYGLSEGWSRWEQRKTWADNLAEFLGDVGGKSTIIRGIPKEFVERFAQFDPKAVATRWNSYFPLGISNELTSDPDEPILSKPGGYLHLMLEGLQPQQIDEFIFGRLLALPATPSKSDRQILEKWIATREHAGLKALPLLWASNGKALSRTFASMTAEQYEMIVTSIIHWRELPISLLDALVESHASLWIRLCARYLPPEELKKSLNPLSKFGDAIIDELADQVYNLPNEARWEIINWLEKNPKTKASKLRLMLNVPLKSNSKWF